ncbi:MAG TPA: hypothetical protein VFV34_11805 [Blastocatellia bacterium]|nr:hypothetical protein [Blastocatellia bacterium]
MRVFIFSIVASMLLIGFAVAQSGNQAGIKPDNDRAPQVMAVAALNELSHDAAGKLRVIPDSQMLATQIRQVASAPAQGAQRCAADASTTFYDARVTTPITVFFM